VEEFFAVDEVGMVGRMLGHRLGWVWVLGFAGKRRESPLKTRGGTLPVKNHLGERAAGGFQRRAAEVAEGARS
jgi:hypothetical protein